MATPTQKHLDNYPCPNCKKDRMCQYRYKNQWCKKCGHIKTGKKRDTRIQKKCLICDEKILVPKCLMKRKKFCSVKCRTDFQIGKKHSKEHRRKISLAGIGRVLDEKTKMKISAGHQGIPIEKWDGFIKSQNDRDRRKFLCSIRQEALTRDDYLCQICGCSEGSMHVDHIQSFAKHPSLRFEIDNLRTLCRSCHYMVTFDREMPEESTWGLRKVEGVYES